MAPDNPLYALTHAWSYLSSGDNQLYCWHTTDAGYTWSDPVFMGVTVSPTYGGNCGPKLRMGSGGYVAGIFNNSVGGMHNDGWPHFIESTDNGLTWSDNVQQLPVPHVDSTLSQFWWHELDCEVINSKPFVVVNDIGLDSMWLFIGRGSAGAWQWAVQNISRLGACSLYYGDTLFYCYPSMYPSISNEPVSQTILISYKAHYLKATPQDTFYNGAHIGGVYSRDNGKTWKICGPLSISNQHQIGWDNWGSTEVSHRLVNIDGDIHAYGIWGDPINKTLYFESGEIRPLSQMDIYESADQTLSAALTIEPTVFSENTTIRIAEYSNPFCADNNWSIFINDLSGRSIRSFIIEPKFVRTGIRWNGDDSGQPVPAGVYIVNLVDPEGIIRGSSKVLKIK